ncbi:alkaline shock response membrane anchor protein AmaP [bacterium]|nr:alkaline shock response membrane anchor protein AmaP [bacterium]MCK4326041.1 alkaline shock response membrane anchor protein AmaP [bacterium]MCK4437287.1 alkaline shock response membrane anchor protein AmaP [bacterium]
MRGLSTAVSIVVLVAVGVYLVCLAIGVTSIEQMASFIKPLEETKVITGIAGIISLAMGFSLLYLALRKFTREPSMAFQNPEGEVRVTFNAIEDFVKRLGGKLEEVKEMHPEVIATKEGLEIHNRITLGPNLSIPEASSRIQETIKKYVEDVLGIRDIVAIKVLITKIAHEEVKEKEEEVRREAEIK